MRRWAILLGCFLVFIGLTSLVEAIWKIDIGRFIWPLILIAVGILVLVRPPIPWWWFNYDSRWVKETNRSGEFYVKDETIDGFVGDVNLDFTQSVVPEGETRYRLNGFVGDIKIKTNDTVGINVRAHCFVGNVKIFGEESTGVMAPVEAKTRNFDTATKKITVDVNYFVADVNVLPA